MKAKSKSYVTSAKTMFAAMTILSKNGGSMPIRILMQEIEKAVELSDWEKEVLAVSSDWEQKEAEGTKGGLWSIYELIPEGNKKMI